MANSSLVSSLKEAIINELVQDERIFHAINSPDITAFEDREKLIYQHIFPYHVHPENLTGPCTVLTIQVQIPKTSDAGNMWVVPRLEIWIISHDEHMKVDNIPQIPDNRNDYISKLLDKKFNGRDTLGGSAQDSGNLHLYGNLELISNTEGVFSKNFLYRQMIFEMKDINNSFCEEM